MWANKYSSLSSSHLQIKFGFFFPATAWTHTTVSFLVLLLLPSLAFPSIYPAFVVTTDPTTIFFLPRFASFLSLISGWTGEVLIVLGGRGPLVISEAISKLAVEFFCVFLQENRSQQKNAWLSESFSRLLANQIAWLHEPCILCQIWNKTIYHNSKLV